MWPNNKQSDPLIPPKQPNKFDSYFTKSQDIEKRQYIKPPKPVRTTTEADRSVMQVMAAGISSVSASIGQKIDVQYHQLETYRTFCCIFIAGAFFIFLSMLMLPSIVVTPSTVANLFNIGSLTILMSFAVLWGPKEFCIDRFLFSDRQQYAVGYFVTLLLCLYFGITKSRILCILTLCAEAVFMLYFIASYFPGGTAGVTKLLQTFWSVLKSCFTS